MFKIYTEVCSVDLALLLLRIVSAGLLLRLSIHKIANFKKVKENFPTFWGLSTISSLRLTLICQCIFAPMLALGLLFPIAASGLTAMFLIVVFDIHKGWKFEDHEFALHYLIMYVILLISGPGKWALDTLLFH